MYQYAVGSSKPVFLEGSVKNVRGPRSESEPAHYTSLSLAVDGVDAVDIIRLSNTGCTKSEGYVFCNLDTIGENIEVGENSNLVSGSFESVQW